MLALMLAQPSTGLVTTTGLITPGTGLRRPPLRLRGGQVVSADGQLKRGAGASARYKAYDLNKDGVLSEEELKLAVDSAVQRVNQHKSDEPIIIQFTHSAAWLWRQWRGTAFELVWQPMLFSMGAAGAMEVLVPDTAPMFATPDAAHPVVQKLLTLNSGWNMLLTLTTFVLTFFLSQCYTYWRAMFTEGRSIQGRFHDTNMLLAAHAERDAQGQYTPAATGLLQAVARNCRLTHALFWASHDQSLSVLHTPRGLQQMVARGLMTEEECDKLVHSGTPDGSRWQTVVAWIMTRIALARQRGQLIGGAGFEQEVLSHLCGLRAKMGTIGDGPVDRMPLAYVHIVQVLVDFLLLLAPVALYPKLGMLAVPVTGILTVFYRGLLGAPHPHPPTPRTCARARTRIHTPPPHCTPSHRSSPFVCACRAFQVLPRPMGQRRLRGAERQRQRAACRDPCRRAALGCRQQAGADGMGAAARCHGCVKRGCAQAAQGSGELGHAASQIGRLACSGLFRLGSSGF